MRVSPRSSRLERDGAIFKVEQKFTFQTKKKFIVVVVLMPMSALLGNARSPRRTLAISPSFAKAESDWVAQTGEPPVV